MDKLSTFRPVTFEEGYYTISEAIKRIDDTFNLSIPTKTVKKKKQLDRSNQEYRSVYQHIRREIEKLNLTDENYVKKESGRNTKYSHLIWNLIVNEILYSWLCEKAKKEEYHKFKEWRRKQQEYGQRQARIMEAAEQMDELQQTHSSDLEDAIELEFQKRKLAIALDFIFSHYIELDEKLLRTDIEIDYCFDEVAPSAYDLMVNERLQNPKNYYTVKKPPMPSTFK